MSQRIHATYDGEVLRPENGAQLEANTRYLLIVEKDEADQEVSADTPYPLSLIQDIATDMGVTDLAENHDRYAHGQ
ncbi:MAG TPA: hypothetical protein VN643_01010 [Pyrinomonadaceae bacterium]|nr:hypothetical protein [Pyrinomonadaceae bacterium]